MNFVSASWQIATLETASRVVCFDLTSGVLTQSLAFIFKNINVAAILDRICYGKMSSTIVDATHTAEIQVESIAGTYFTISYVLFHKIALLLI